MASLETSAVHTGTKGHSVGTSGDFFVLYVTLIAVSLVLVLLRWWLFTVKLFQDYLATSVYHLALLLESCSLIVNAIAIKKIAFDVNNELAIRAWGTDLPSIWLHDLGILTLFGVIGVGNMIIAMQYYGRHGDTCYAVSLFVYTAAAILCICQLGLYSSYGGFITRPSGFDEPAPSESAWKALRSAMYACLWVFGWMWLVADCLFCELEEDNQYIRDPIVYLTVFFFWIFCSVSGIVSANLNPRSYHALFKITAVNYILEYCFFIMVFFYFHGLMDARALDCDDGFNRGVRIVVRVINRLLSYLISIWKQSLALIQWVKRFLLYRFSMSSSDIPTIS